MPTITNLPVAPELAGSAVIPVVQAGTTYKATLASLVSNVSGTLNVKTFGAKGDGVTVDSAAFQAAADAVPSTGGVIVFPPGLYITNTPVFLKSNTTLMMHGANIRATPVASWVRPTSIRSPIHWQNGYWMFINTNLDATVLTDHDISVHGGTFDYSYMGSAPGGGAHAIEMHRVTRVKVTDGVAFSGENYVAFLGCSDTLVEGCSAFDFGNAAWDHWHEPKNARVIGCYSQSNHAVQHANFNATGNGLVGALAENFIMLGCTMVTLPGGTNPAASIFLDPLGSGHSVRNVIIADCQLHNVIITARSNVANVKIDNCQFWGDNGSNVSPIFSYGDAGGTPDAISVTNCTFIDPYTASPQVGVLDLRGTNSRATNNTITGTHYSVPGIYFSTPGIDFGNVVSTGSTTTGTSPSSGGQIKAANGQGFTQFDTLNSAIRWFVQTDNNMRIYGSSSSGGVRDIAYHQQRSDTSAWDWKVAVNYSSYFTMAVATVAAAGTTIATATAITANMANVTSCVAGVTDGVGLTSSTGRPQTIVNSTAATLKVYTNNSGSGQIDAGGVGVPTTILAGKSKTFVMVASNDFRTIAAT